MTICAKILPMRTVAMVTYDQAPMFEMGVACEVFGSDRTDAGLPTYRFLICAAEPPPLRTENGLPIAPELGLEALAEAGTVVIPAWRDFRERPPEPLLEALRDAHRRGARIASLCTGAFVLAAAGLLDGRPATTHWMHAPEMARRFPAVKLDPAVLYVDGGDGIYTSAGSAAGMDLCLHLLRLDHGAAAANMVARRMVVPPHRDGGQAQFVEAPLPTAATGDRLAATLDWAIANLDQPLGLPLLAAHAQLSERTFARRFMAVTGSTPLRWLLRQRVSAAQRLLETSDLTVEEIAERCGFGSPASLRLHFGRQVGTSPTSYRLTFREIVA
jgi:transcriptional regulator GlxA family with amidase domain